MQELRDYILYILIGNNEKTVQDERYQKVIATLSEEFYPSEDNLNNKKTPMFDAIYSLIIKTIHYQTINGSVSPTDKTVWDLLTPEFCVTCAYEYILNVERHNKIVAEQVRR